MLPNDRFRYRSTTDYARSDPPSPCPTGSEAKWREALGHAETRFHDIAAAFAKGEAILFAEARRIDSELIEEDARMARLLAIDGQNQLLKEEEEAIACALYDEALREFRPHNEHGERLDRLDDHVNSGCAQAGQERDAVARHVRTEAGFEGGRRLEK